MSETTTTAKTAPKSPSFKRGKNLLAVASGKGGVGKTWFSVTLAHALARMGKKVLLFDGDLGLANVDVQLGLMPKRDLNDVIRGRLGLDKVIQRYEDGGFDIIAGRSGQASLSALPSQRLAHLRDQLIEVSDNYDIVIADLGAGVDRTVRMSRHRLPMRMRLSSLVMRRACQKTSRLLLIRPRAKWKVKRPIRPF